MLIFRTIQELKNQLNSIRSDKKTIGFVPTMGALHKGHAYLIEQSVKICDFTICSIFVNPTQFNDPNDLEKYPRTIEKDIELLRLYGCNAVFIPEVHEIYSEQELELKQKNIEDRSWTMGMSIDFGSLDKVMEGAHRPGHFNGVAQVVSKLFRIVEPDKAFFGQKDFQQLAIIKSMVKQLGMNIEIIPCPTMRESDGLAMSSRNVRLTPQERNVAPLIYQTLQKVKEMKGQMSPAQLIEMAHTMISNEPTMQLEYFEIVDSETLQPATDFKQGKSTVACIALKLGSVRLIDNMLL